MKFYFSEYNVMESYLFIVLGEKEIEFTPVRIDPKAPPKELLEACQYGPLPTIISNEIVIYGSSIILEYLDERYPYPPIFPQLPAEKAKFRMKLYDLNHDFGKYINYIIKNRLSNDEKAIKLIEKSRAKLQNNLVAIDDLFKKSEYFLGEHFSVLDCYLMTILEKLKDVQVTLPSRKAKNILNYQKIHQDRISVEKYMARPSLDKTQKVKNIRTFLIH